MSSLFEDGHEYAVVVVVVVAILIMSSREDEIEDDVEVRSFPERTNDSFFDDISLSHLFNTQISQSLSLKSFLFSAVLNTHRTRLPRAFPPSTTRFTANRYRPRALCAETPTG